MRFFPVLAFALALPLVASPATAPRPALPSTPPDVAMRLGGLFAKATPAVRSWVDGEARRLRALPRIDAALVGADARQAFTLARPPLTPGQSDVLVAMALYQVLTDLDSEARLTFAEAPADRLAAFQLRRNGVLQTLTSLLAKISRADEAVVQNLR